MSLASKLDNVRIKELVKAFEKRESMGDGRMDTVLAHRNWLKSAGGKEDVAYLAHWYDKVDTYDRTQMCLEMARTGAVEVVPLLAKAFQISEDGNTAISGVFYASTFGNAEKPFRNAVAGPVAGWITLSAKYKNTAIKLLPGLDAEVASRVLLTSEFLSPDAKDAPDVLSGFNDAKVTVPMPWINPF